MTDMMNFVAVALMVFMANLLALLYACVGMVLEVNRNGDGPRAEAWAMVCGGLWKAQPAAMVVVIVALCAYGIERLVSW